MHARRLVTLLMWATLVALVLAGCAGPPPPPSAGHATSYAVQGSANALTPEPGDAERTRLTELAADPDTDDAVAWVVGSADDVVKVDLEPRRPNGDIENGPDRARELIAARLAALQDAIRDVSARMTDDRPLDQLAVAARTGAGTIVLLHDGITTTDPLDMRVSGWDAAPADVAADLSARHLLPDLHGRDVTIAGLGRVAGRQPEPNLAERAALAGRWSAICTASGGRCRIDESVRPPTPPVSGRDAPVVAPAQVTTTAGPAGVEWSVPAPVLFGPDSCDLLDPRAAAAVLSPLADQLRTGTRTVTVSGRTAPVGPGDGRALAGCRAEAAARILRDAGVPASAITDVRGDGSTADPPEASRDAQGRTDPTRLAALRRVVFTVTGGGPS